MWPSTWRYIRCGVRGYLAQRCCCNRVRYGVCNNHDRRVRDEAGSLISVRLWYGQRSRLRRRWHGLQHSRRRWRLEDCCRGSHSSGIPRPDGHPRFWVLPRAENLLQSHQWQECVSGRHSLGRFSDLQDPDFGEGPERAEQFDTGSDLGYVGLAQTDGSVEVWNTQVLTGAKYYSHFVGDVNGDRRADLIQIQKNGGTSWVGLAR